MTQNDSRVTGALRVMGEGCDGLRARSLLRMFGRAAGLTESADHRASQFGGTQCEGAGARRSSSMNRVADK